MSLHPVHLGATVHVFKSGRRRRWTGHGPEALARQLSQEEVIMEIQKRGIVQRIYTVTP